MSEVWSVWFLIGAALVFFMQCGFAMVETGFTRAKNAGNIIMKNLMDFCIGTPMFMLLGFGLMMSENYFFGLIGKPDMQLFTNFAGEGKDWSSFVFNLVFCATAATIVSGSMAERTKFSAYCIYSAIISAVVYPIEAGWVWNPQGWLVGLGFVDFAGGAAIHSVGRAKVEEEVVHGHNALVVTEIPYQVNKARLVEKIAQLVKEKKIDGMF